MSIAEYVPLDLSFELTIPQSQEIIDRAFSLVNRSADVLNDKEYQATYSGTKIIKVLKNVAEANKILSTDNQSDGLERAEALLNMCHSLVADMKDMKFNFEESELMKLFSERLEIEVDMVPNLVYLQYFQLKCLIHEKKGNDLEAAKADFSVYKRIWRDTKMNPLDLAFITINCAVEVLLTKWDKFKLLNECLYLLHASESVLWVNRKTHQGPQYQLCMRYLNFGWVIYIGRLLDWSKQTDADETMKVEYDYLVIFKTQLTPKEFLMPRRPLKYEGEILTVYKELQKIRREMRKWGSLKLNPTLTSYQVADQVINYAYRMFPCIKQHRFDDCTLL